MATARVRTKVTIDIRANEVHIRKRESSPTEDRELSRNPNRNSEILELMLTRDEHKWTLNELVDELAKTDPTLHPIESHGFRSIRNALTLMAKPHEQFPALVVSVGIWEYALVGSSAATEEVSGSVQSEVLQRKILAFAQEKDHQALLSARLRSSNNSRRMTISFTRSSGPRLGTRLSPPRAPQRSISVSGHPGISKCRLNKAYATLLAKGLILEEPARGKYHRRFYRLAQPMRTPINRERVRGEQAEIPCRQLFIDYLREKSETGAELIKKTRDQYGDKLAESLKAQVNLLSNALLCFSNSTISFLVYPYA